MTPRAPIDVLRESQSIEDAPTEILAARASNSAAPPIVEEVRVVSLGKVVQTIDGGDLRRAEATPQ